MTHAQNMFLTQNIFSGMSPANASSGLPMNPGQTKGDSLGSPSLGFLSFLVQQINEGQDLEGLEDHFKSFDFIQSSIDGTFSPENTDNKTADSLKGILSQGHSLSDLESLDLEKLSQTDPDLYESLKGIDFNGLDFASGEFLNANTMTQEQIIDVQLQIRDFVNRLIEIAQTQGEVTTHTDVSADTTVISAAIANDTAFKNAPSETEQASQISMIPTTKPVEENSSPNGINLQDSLIASINTLDQMAEDVSELDLLQTHVDEVLLSQGNLATATPQNTVTLSVLTNNASVQEAPLRVHLNKALGLQPSTSQAQGEQSSAHAFSKHAGNQISQAASATLAAMTAPADGLAAQGSVFQLNTVNLNAGTALSNTNAFFDASQNTGKVTDIVENLAQFKVAPDQTSIQTTTSPVVANKNATSPHPALEQLSVQIRKAAAAGHNTNFTVRLQPAELGMVRIELQFNRDKSASARIIAERPETLSMLQRDAHALQAALEESGLDASAQDFTFDLAQEDPHTGQSDNGDTGAPKEPRTTFHDDAEIEELSAQITQFIDPETGLSRINLVV